MPVVGLRVVERVRVAARPVEPLRPDLAVRAAPAHRDLPPVPGEEVAADVVREDRRLRILEDGAADVLRHQDVAGAPERPGGGARRVVDLHAPHVAALDAVDGAVAAPAVQPARDLEPDAVHAPAGARLVARVHRAIDVDDVGAGRRRRGRRAWRRSRGGVQDGRFQAPELDVMVLR